jgi:hypothetical protein
MGLAIAIALVGPRYPGARLPQRAFTETTHTLVRAGAGSCRTQPKLVVFGKDFKTGE